LPFAFSFLHSAFVIIFAAARKSFCGSLFQIKGGLAHLVERKHGMFEVIGSSPISSTFFNLQMN
jgi:hypothetical protein